MLHVNMQNVTTSQRQTAEDQYVSACQPCRPPPSGRPRRASWFPILIVSVLCSQVCLSFCVPRFLFFPMRALSGNVICFCAVTILCKDSLRKKLSPSVGLLLSDSWLWTLLWDVALSSKWQRTANRKGRERGTVLNGGKAPCVLICFFCYLYHCYYS